MMIGSNYYQAVIKQIIDQDPATFKIERAVKQGDGYGGTIETITQATYTGRIYNRKSAREVADVRGVTVKTSLSTEKILTLSSADIRRGDILEYQGRKLRVSHVNDYFGICKQSELEAIEYEV